MNELLNMKRHGLAHVMAQAIQENFANVKCATGPFTDDGFYYDFDFNGQEFSENDFKTIEKKWQTIKIPKEGFT